MIGWERFEVKASTQWAMASTPVAAVTKGGTETVSAGSMIAMSASISTLSVAILFIVAGSVISARVPTSLPVPAVVGIWARTTRRAGARFGPEMSGRRLSLVTRTATSLARSMALPPPKPMTASASAALAAATAASRLGRSGSGFTSPKRAGSRRPRMSRRAALTLSATTNGRRGAGRLEPRGEGVDLTGAEADDRAGAASRSGSAGWSWRSPQARASRRAFWTSGSGSRPAASRRRV